MNEQVKQDGHAGRGHHPYSPSTLQARELSPCFKPRQAPVSEAASEASKRGTMQHEAVEKGADHQDLSDEEADAVAAAIRLVDNSKAIVRKGQPDVEIVELTEPFLPIDDLEVESPKGERWLGSTAGYPDKVLVWRPKDYDTHERHALIPDWKFGRYAVADARVNRQGHAYLMGVAHHLAKQGLKLRSAQVLFFSPHRGEAPTSCTFRDEDGLFSRMYSELVAIVRRSQAIDHAIEKKGFAGLTADERALVRTSPKCIFCDRLGLCPAITALGSQIALAAKPLEAPKDVNGFAERDPVELAKVIVLGDILKAWAEQRRKRAVQLALDHTEDDRYIPEGYKLSSSYPRKTKNPMELMAFLKERFGPDVVAENVSIPLTNFEKLVAAKAERGQKTAATEEFAEELESKGFTEKSTVPVVCLRMK